MGQFLWGYIFKYCLYTQLAAQAEDPTSRGPRRELTILDMHANMWNAHNTFAHGKTIKEAKEKVCIAVNARVTDLYQIRIS